MKSAAILMCCLISTAHAGSLADYGAPESGKVRIVRDTWGVPHIIASENRSLFFGAGYAQAQDQLINLTLNYRRSEGRIAEVEGKSQLMVDHLVRLFQLPERAQEVYEQLDSGVREQLEGFAAGINQYIAEHRKELPAHVEEVHPWNVISFAMYIESMFSMSHCRRDLNAAGVKLAGSVPIIDHGTYFGSNQFAVSPKRSASGACMLSMDPHLRFTGFYRWYEMHLIGPEVNAMGACFFGNPYVTMGRTENTAWCMTVNGPDLGDVFTFQINPENPRQYNDLDGWKDFTQSQLKYRIAATPGDSDTLIEKQMPAMWTELGPVVAVRDGVAYVFALPTSTSPSRAGQSYAMMKAQNMTDFRDAMKPLGLVMFNILYADRHGDIFYISNGRVPKRDERIDSRKLRPGNEPWARWQGIHPQKELPQLVNPPAGFVLNTNSGPHNTTPEGAPSQDDFPDYMISHQANSRQRRLNHLLSSDELITWEEMETYATDTQIEVNSAQLAAIVRIAELPGEEREQRAAAAELLNAWDHRTDLECRGPALFFTLASDETFVRALGSAEEQPKAAVSAMVAALTRMEQTLGSIDVPWSDFSRIKRGKIDQPIAGSGGLSTAGVSFAGAALRPTGGRVAKNGRRYAGGGSSYGMIIDFSGKTKAMSCLPFGVSEHPRSPHFADMLPVYARRDFKPVWFFPNEVKANAKSDITLTLK